MSPTTRPTPGTSTATSVAMQSRRHVLDRHGAVGRQLGAHGAHWRVVARDARPNAPEVLERAHDADEPVAAHAEVRAVVEEDDARRGVGRDRRREQRADDRVVAARLAHDGAPQMIVVRAQVIAPLGHRRAAGLRPAVDDDARRLAFGVRVDDANRRGKGRRVAQGCAMRERCHGLICTVLISV